MCPLSWFCCLLALLGTACGLCWCRHVSEASPWLRHLEQPTDDTLQLSTTTPDPLKQPFFENTTQRSIVVAIGKAAELKCRVRNLADRAVSWIRKRDLHILTIGVMTYTNDQRFEAEQRNNASEWRLRITSVQPRDTGVYECQVSTEPKISQAYRLTVVAARAKILGSADIFFKSGSDINLTCIAQQAPAPPSYIYWYKDGELINYSPRGGINVLTERLTRSSKLLIARAAPRDSGNYTCTPSNSNSDSVLVHVISREHPAAMQHERGHHLKCSGWLCTPLLLLLWLLLNWLGTVPAESIARYSL